MLRVNDLEVGQIRVDEAFKRAEHGEDRIGDPKTEGSADVVAIPTDLESQLRAWVRSQNLADADLLFPSAVGGPIDPSNYLDRTLRPLGVKAGVPDINFAMLRRTCATYFRDNLKGAQRQLRHKTPHVTAKHYQQSITAEHRSAVAKLDQELCNPAKKIVPVKKRADFFERGRTRWDRLTPIFQRWLPGPRVLHPYPYERFVATHPRWEPYA